MRSPAPTLRSAPRVFVMEHLLGLVRRAVAAYPAQIMDIVVMKIRIAVAEIFAAEQHRARANPAAAEVVRRAPARPNAV